jgi:CO dehydrogenase maturation factor
MGIKLSICGKGGSGKSTLTSLLANQARENGFQVLVVDSDESNSELYRTLGFQQPPVSLMALVGGKKAIKDKMNHRNIFIEPQIGLKDIPADYKAEHKGLTLVSIGKINQALEGCACPMGVLNREFLKKLRLDKNTIAMVDMEAGIEHFGRGVDAQIDVIILVVEPSNESLSMAYKIKELAAGFGKNLFAVLNKVNSDELAKRLETSLGQKEIVVLGAIPNDTEVFEAGLDGRPIGACGSVFAAQEIFQKLSKHFAV